MAIIGMCNEDSARERISGERSGVQEGNTQGSEVIIPRHNEMPAPPTFLSCRWCWARASLEPWIGGSNVRRIENDRSDRQCCIGERRGGRTKLWRADHQCRNDADHNERYNSNIFLHHILLIGGEANKT